MSHSNTNLLVHCVWSTRNRDRVLEPCHVLLVGIAPDHVHALVRLASASLGEVLQRLKGVSAHEVNQHHRLPKRLEWQDGYWAESFGPADLAPLAQYLRNQRAHHDDSHPAETWQFGSGSPAEPGLLTRGR